MWMKTDSLGQFFDSCSTALWVLSDTCSYCFGLAKSSVDEAQFHEFQICDGSSFKSQSLTFFSEILVH